jgi:integrase
MVRVELPYLWPAKGRAGKLYWFYRRGKLRIPITDEAGQRLAEGAPGFLQAYERINATFQAPGREASGPGSLAAAIELYKSAPQFTTKADRTRKDYLGHLDALAIQYGHLSIRTMPAEFVEAMRDKLAATPRTANYRVAVLKIVLNFAERRRLALGLPRDWRNPAAKIERLKEGPGYRQWPDNLIAKFRETAPDEIRWLMQVALLTGQRGQDCVKMLWSHYDGEGVEVVQLKTGKRLWIPAHRDLKALLEEIPKRNAVILTTPTGRPWRGTYYAQQVQETVQACGLKGYSLHGLRRNATTRLLEAGCTSDQVKSITGHLSTVTVERYAQDVNQKTMARAAIAKLERPENGN